MFAKISLQSQAPSMRRQFDNFRDRYDTILPLKKFWLVCQRLDATADRVAATQVSEQDTILPHASFERSQFAEI